MCDEPLGALAQAAVAEEVASSLRHDLRNKLAAIGQAVRYVKRRGEKEALWAPDDRIQVFLDMVDGELAAAREVVDGASFADQLRGAPTALDLSRALRDAASRHAGMAAIEVSAEATKVLHADARQIALLLTHLIDNAEEASATWVGLSSRDDDAGLILEVADDGPGFEGDPLRPFASTKAGHLGLGLNVARRIAARNHGRLELGRSARGGAAVTILFPAETA